jgi:hypothetical protein
MPAAARLPVFDAMQAGISVRVERTSARPAATVAVR